MKESKLIEQKIGIAIFISDINRLSAWMNICILVTNVYYRAIKSPTYQRDKVAFNICAPKIHWTKINKFKGIQLSKQ